MFDSFSVFASNNFVTGFANGVSSIKLEKFLSNASKNTDEVTPPASTSFQYQLESPAAPNTLKAAVYGIPN